MAPPPRFPTDWLPLASARLYRAQSIEDARRHVGSFFRSHQLTFAEPGQLGDFFHGYATVGGASLHSLRYGASVEVVVPPIHDFYLLQWTLAGSCRYESEGGAFVAGPDTMVLVRPGAGYRKHWSRECLQLMVRMDRATLERAAFGRDAGAQALTARWGPVERTPGSASLYALLEALARDAEAGAGLADGRAAEAAIDLLAKLLIAPFFPEAPAGPFKAPAAPVARAQEYIRINARAPIGVAEIAAASGISTRSLQSLFAREVGMPPLAYLREVRLSLARRLLDDAAPDTVSVTDVALECGFEHLSKFASAYRSRFGELPSQTLRVRRR